MHRYWDNTPSSSFVRRRKRRNRVVNACTSSGNRAELQPSRAVCSSSSSATARAHRPSLKRPSQCGEQRLPGRETTQRTQDGGEDHPGVSAAWGWVAVSCPLDTVPSLFAELEEWSMAWNLMAPCWGATAASREHTLVSSTVPFQV